MSASWSIADGTVTLTLDGTGSGQVSRSRTFTGLEANELYTFYLVVDPSVAGIGAFLEVVGGDTTVATATGPQTLTARGDTNASGEITVRFGAQHIESSPVDSGGDALDYASIAALEAVWTLTATGGVTHSESIDTSEVDAGDSSSVKMTLSHPGFVAGDTTYTRTFTGLTPSTGYTATARVRAENRPWFQGITFNIGGGNDPVMSGSQNPDGQWVTVTVTGSSDGSGNLPVKFGLQGGTLGALDWTAWFGGIAILGAGGGGAGAGFSHLAHCVGTGAAGTGSGDAGEGRRAA